MVQGTHPSQEITVNNPPINQEIEDLRKEALVIVGHASTHQGKIEINPAYNEHQTHHLERLLGRVLLRKLNKVGGAR